MGMITELEAVNFMLVNAGESPVTSLDVDTGIDVGIAQQLLDEASLDYQIRGLAQNWKYTELEPESDGRIYLPTADADDDGIISVDLLSHHIAETTGPNGESMYIMARVTGDDTPLLYNITDDTQYWDDDTYKVLIFRKLKWKHLDTVIQRAILAKAARRYQMFMQGDQEADLYLQDEEATYTYKAKGANAHDRKANLFNSGPNPVQRIADRRRNSFPGFGSGRYPGT
jgi:hypothetical protein